MKYLHFLAYSIIIAFALIQAKAQNGENSATKSSIELPLLWERNFAGSQMAAVSKAIAIDKQGNVYITGTSASVRRNQFPEETRIVTIKYDSDGSQKWITEYAYATKSDNFAINLHVDNDGFIYVAGRSRDLQKNDVVYVLIKYDPDGNESWRTSYQRSSGADFLVDMKVDELGNVFLTGASYDGTSHYDYVTVKFNPQGQEEWSAIYNGERNFRDEPTALEYDAQGNIYVTGKSYGDTTLFDYLTVKYNQSGAQLWTARRPGRINGNDEPRAMAVGKDGDVLVTGSSLGRVIIEENVFISYYDYLTVKYDTDGAELWSAIYDGPQQIGDAAWDVALDNDGNVYVTGSSESDFATIKYATDGRQQWVARYNGPTNGFDYGQLLIVDNKKFVHVTGASFTITQITPFVEGHYDIQTLIYAPTGDIVATGRYDSPEKRYDEPTALALDTSGVLYVSGISRNNSLFNGFWEFSQYRLLKYDLKGITSVTQNADPVPDEFRLLTNYPNPFHVTTTIEYYLKKRTDIVISVHDLNGRTVKRAAFRDQNNGIHDFVWDGRDDFGYKVSAGVYIFTLRGNHRVESRKVVLLK